MALIEIDHRNSLKAGERSHLTAGRAMSACPIRAVGSSHVSRRSSGIECCENRALLQTICSNHKLAVKRHLRYDRSYSAAEAAKGKLVFADHVGPHRVRQLAVQLTYPLRFGYLNDVLAKGSKQPLELSDIGEVDARDTAETTADAFAAVWYVDTRFGWEHKRNHCKIGRKKFRAKNPHFGALCAALLAWAGEHAGR